MEIRITENCKEIELNSKLPLTTQIDVGASNKEPGTKNENSRTYSAKIKLLNLFPVKNVGIKLVSEKYVIPCGNLFGIKIFTEGVVVVGMADVHREDGTDINPARLAGLAIGDVILKINDQIIDSNDSIAKLIEESGGAPLKIDAKRNGMNFRVELHPEKSNESGRYHAGIWIRDSSAGIGTMSFCDPKKQVFCGLGHGISDADVNKLLPLNHGEIVDVYISGVKKGQKGTPGELKGHFKVNDDIIGTLHCNAETGVYGQMKKVNFDESKRMLIAMKQEVKTGRAKIICTVSGDKQEFYDVRIDEVNYQKDSPTKNMIVQITDRSLIEKTGGIVQGMSGTPIIQNGKIVGVITHVLVNDPRRGYGIFAENMQAQMESLYDYDRVG
jgi:stage IV sporulation protein B